MFYANSNKQQLDQHLTSVESSTHKVIDTCLHSLDSKMKQQVSQSVSIAALHHDDGKVDHNFQNYLATKETKDGWVENNPLHHELSLLTVSEFCKETPLSVKKAVKFAVYYHHAEQRRKKSIKSVVENYITQQYCDNLNTLHNTKFTLDDLLEPADTYQVPEFFSTVSMDNVNLLDNIKSFKAKLDQDILNHLTKFTLVTADRYVSKQSNLESVAEWSSEFDDTNLRNSIIEYRDRVELVGERTDLQIEAANRVCDYDFNTVLACAGAGKTRLAVLAYEAKSKHKGIMWVCPRLAVCESLLAELSENLHGISISIISSDKTECYIDGELSKLDVWSADIIITTIDQVISTLVRHTNVEKFKEFLTRFVVFDEYHETLNILELYYVTMLLMRMKEHQEYSHINISATPSPLHLRIIGKNEDSWEYLINVDSFNTKKVKLNFVDEYEDATKNTLYIFNTAKKAQLLAQEQWLLGNTDFSLYHARYNNLDKKDLTSQVLADFGKGCMSDKILYSSPISQASLNISRKNMVTELTTPENFLQRLGRLNRFAEYDNATAKVIVNSDTAFDRYKGAVKNTNSYKFKIVRDKMKSTNSCFYAKSSYEFYVQLCKKFANNTHKDSYKSLIGHEVEIATTELTKFYFDYLVSAIKQPTKNEYLQESYDFINQAVEYLAFRKLFKPFKSNHSKLDAGAKVSGGFRSDSMFANMHTVTINSNGVEQGDYLTNNNATDKLVSVTHNDLNEIDLNKSLGLCDLMTVRDFAKTVKYRTRSSYANVEECLTSLAHNSTMPLYVSGLKVQLLYVSAVNGSGKTLKIGHYKFNEKI